MPHQLYLYAAGSNGNGQLATGDTEDAHIFTPCVFADHAPGVLPPNTEHILAYAGGGNHTLLLLSFRPDDPNAPARVELWGTGSNAKGQLGPSLNTQWSTFQPIHLPLPPLNLHEHTLTHIAAGWDTTFVVLRSPTRPHTDTILSCGGNDFGDLGAGFPAPLAAVHVLDFTPAIGACPFEVLHLAAGPHHALAVLRTTDGHAHLVGWGSARHGQLGAPAPSTHPTAPIATYALPRAVPLPARHPADAIAGLALGSQHSVLLLASGELLGLGSDRKAQLAGLGTVRAARALACSWSGTYVLVDAPGARREGPVVLSTGSGARGQLGRHHEGAAGAMLAAVEVPSAPGSERAVRRLVCGSEHVLVTAEPVAGGEVEVWGWGWNEHGNLGTGGTEDVYVATKLWPRHGADGGRVVGIGAGCGTSWIAVARPSA